MRLTKVYTRNYWENNNYIILENYTNRLKTLDKTRLILKTNEEDTHLILILSNYNSWIFINERRK